MNEEVGFRWHIENAICLAFSLVTPDEVSAIAMIVKVAKEIGHFHLVLADATVVILDNDFSGVSNLQLHLIGSYWAPVLRSSRKGPSRQVPRGGDLACEPSMST